MDGELEVLEQEIKQEATPSSEASALVAAKEQGSEPSVEDLAARDYQTLLPKFEKKLYPMSRRQQQRVIMALMKYPLEDDKPRFSYPPEQEAFVLGMQIQDCKLVLMNAVLNLMKDGEKMKQLSAEIEKLKKEKEANVSL